jgi:hypothetical protein
VIRRRTHPLRMMDPRATTSEGSLMSPPVGFADRVRPSPGEKDAQSRLGPSSDVGVTPTGGGAPRPYCDGPASHTPHTIAGIHPENTVDPSAPQLLASTPSVEGCVPVQRSG